MSKQIKPNQFYLPCGALITELPILFQTDMVQANLEDRKTQTRRTSDLDVPADLLFDKIEFNNLDWPKKPLIFKKKVQEIGNTEFYEIVAAFKSPFGKPGDLLWVKETFTCWAGMYQYKANTANGDEIGIWRPSIHMPKSAARIWLMIEDIRFERVQGISEEDAIAEGIMEFESRNSGWSGPMYGLPTSKVYAVNAYIAFHNLWVSINGIESWRSNPWVWVIKYRILSKTGRPSLHVIEKNYLEVTSSPSGEAGWGRKEVSNG